MATFYHSNPRTLGTIKNWVKTQYLRANIFIPYTKIGDIGAVHRETHDYTQFHSRGAKSMWKVLFYLLVCIHSPVQVWWSEKSASSSHHVGHRAQTQTLSLGGWCLYLLSEPSQWPLYEGFV